jgi:outer membrane protein assembly factor BamB
MNLPGPEGVPHLVEIHATVDIDLNGGPGANQPIELWVKYPGRADFTYIDTYTTRGNGDLDVYDFDFNETGDFELKWALPPPSTEESNVEIARVVLEIPPDVSQTIAFIGALPNPVGVGQEVLFHVGIQDALASQELGWEGLSITITKPDGTTDTISNIRTDSTGGTGRVYVPDQVGNYSVQSHFPEQENPRRTGGGFGGTALSEGAIMYASDSPILTLVVQDEPLVHYPGSPLPTEYWTRPINAQHREWYPVAGSSWHDQDYNEAPESPHVLWTKPLTTGGLVGGDIGIYGFEHGDAYQGKWGGGFFSPSYPMVIAGKLIYTHHNSIDPLIYTCVDLRTGEVLWEKTFLDNRTINFGQNFYWDSYNYHQTYSYIWAQIGSDWYAFDPMDGFLRLVMENVPSGTTVRDERDNIYRYDISLSQAQMSLWNWSARISMQGSFRGPNVGTYDCASTSSSSRRAWALDDVPIPTGLPGSVRAIEHGERVVGSDVSLDEVTIWAFSLKPGQEGQLLFKNTWNAPSSWRDPINQTRSWENTDLESNVGTVGSSTELRYWGFSLETGDLLWGPTKALHYLDRYSRGERAYDGKYYAVGQGGQLHCWDIKTGELKWIYNADDPYTEFLWGNQWSQDILFASGGKIYLFHSEHSPVNPLFRGAPAVCLDAETGEEVWRVDGLFRKTDWGAGPIMGDSVIAMYNTYDQRVYAIGKGPSAITATASPKVSVHGSSVLVEGMVTDVSPGTNDIALTMRFPNGVPAVSDESQGEWMKYVYAQFERPADATGVDVILTVIDPNNNVYDIATVTSDSSGMYKKAFIPEVPGEYTVIATFAGSNSYFGSYAETAICVDEAPLPPPPEEPLTLPPTETYITAATVAIIIAIAIVGLLLFRKR